MPAIDFEALRAQERKAARARRAAASDGPATVEKAGASSLSEPERAERPPDAGREAAAPIFSLPARPDRAALDDGTHRVGGAVSRVWHVPEWCSAEEEAALVRCADSAPWTV